MKSNAMDDLFPVGPVEKIEELKREIKFRRRVYARMIDKGRLKQEVADRRIRIMEAILEDYESEQQVKS